MSVYLSVCVCVCVCVCILTSVNVCKDNTGLHLFNGRNFSAGLWYINCVIYIALSIFCRAHYSQAIFSQEVENEVNDGI